MSLTKQQIRDRAANALGILPFGQALEEPDVSRIEQAYSEVYNYLKTKGLATWPYATGSVPDELAPYVSALVAFNCLDGYGVSNDRYVRIVNNASVAEKNIRELITTDTPPQEDQKDY